ncbi:MAG TPA: EAL domain-containing protein [Bryobacteraceae bacterium]|nr:EAL domain-containing protein [Bryobacteraceae bacterium]
MPNYAPPYNEGVRRNPFVISDGLSAAAYTRLCSMLPVVAGLYLLFSILALPGAISLEWFLAFAAGTGSLAAWWLSRRKKFPIRYTHAAAGVLALAVTGHAVSGWATRVTEAPATAIFLLLVASGATLYSLRWHVAIAATALLAWMAAAWPAAGASEMWYGMVGLLTTAALSTFLVHYRVRKFHAGLAVREGTFHQEYVEQAVQGTQDGLWHWDLKTDEFHYSAAWASLLGFQPEELRKHPDEWLTRVHPGYIARLRSELSAHLYGEAPHFCNEHRIQHKDGSYMWVLARGTVVRNAEGEPTVLAGSHSDLTPLIKAEKRLLTDTFKDQLTGLANRTFLLSHLDIAVEEKQTRGPAAPLFAVIFLDLDRFKFINDTMGHDVGDELLIAVAGRLRNCARQGDVVARFGGDEFVVLLRNLKDGDEALEVGERMLRALLSPFHLGNREIQSGGSIGIALSRDPFRKSDEILRYGDIAMYQAKKRGKGQVVLFDATMLEESNRQDALQRDLEMALQRNQLVLHYQPSIHLATGKIIGAEALIRWQRSAGELLLPGEFLPLAEKSGLINEIGEWALRTACAQNSAWQQSGMGPLKVSVNLAARQLQQQDLPQLVQRVLAETKLRPEYLELELTEAALLRNVEQAAGTIKALGDSGIRTAIDNFGTGFASLNYLRQFQFHTLKMDRKFVSEMTTDQKAAAAARGLITMAHHMGISVVAEGVEKRDQVQFLVAEQCDHVQGYLTGRPVPGDVLTSMLRAGGNIARPSPKPATVAADLSNLRAAHSAPPPPARMVDPRQLRG